jgi:hypothetical protein
VRISTELIAPSSDGTGGRGACMRAWSLRTRAGEWTTATRDRIFEPFFSNEETRHRPRAGDREADCRGAWWEDQRRQRT